MGSGAIPAVLLLVASLQLSQASSTPRYVQADGTIWKAAPHQRGVELRSAQTAVLLERSCTAFSAALGRGTWSWANGGFLVEFPQRRLAFPRQQLRIDNAGACRF